MRRVPSVGLLARLVGGGTAAVLLVAVLGGLGAPGADGESSLWGIALAVTFAAWLIRAFLIGVTVTTEGVTVRAWFWTYRFASSDIVELNSRPYDGMAMTWGTRPQRLRELVVVTRRRTWAFPCTVATQTRMADQLGVMIRLLHGREPYPQ